MVILARNTNSLFKPLITLIRLMPAVLAILKDRKDLLSNEIFLLSAVTALQHVIETLLHFISPFLRDATSQVHLMIGEVISRWPEDE